MFGQKPPSGGPIRGNPAESDRPSALPKRPSLSPAAAGIPSRAMPASSSVSGGSLAIPGLGSGRSSDPIPFSPKREECQLLVGKGIRMNGEIFDCAQLMILGTVEATLKDSSAMSIAEGGLFKGVAEVEDADISGTFDGTLTVNGRLVVRETGLVTGEIRYGELEIQRGGRLVGDIQAKVADRAPADAPATPGKGRGKAGSGKGSS
jgi:cytoskeletal protein CcmA (bactofilin family)